MQVIIERNLIAAGKKLQGIESIDHRTQASIRLNVAGLETTHVLKASFDYAERIAKEKGLEPVKPANKNYRGSVIALTKHHAIQNIGMNKVVIHELAKIQGKQIIEIGTKLDINYQAANPVVKAELVNENQKPRTR
jgi:hypothetical protein